MAKDFLAETVDERPQKNPALPDLVREAETRRKLAALRERKALPQTVVAARMSTSASGVSTLEAGGDVKLFTLERYCAAIGEKLAVEV